MNDYTNNKDDVLEDCTLKNGLWIDGRVIRPLFIPTEELCRMENEELTDFPVFCSSGTPKGSISSLKGVLLENLIRKVDIIREDENDTKRMFIVVTADDGYKVVFSWQEIFNSPMGGGVLVVVEKEGRSLCAKGEGLELVSAEDYYTGGRYVKHLQRVDVMIAE